MKQSVYATVVCAVVLSSFTFPSHARAQQPADYQSISDKFFAMLQQGKSDEGIDYLFGTNPGLKKLPGKADQLKAQFMDIQNQLGAYISHSKLAETKVAGMLVYQHYFVAYERQPISVRLTFYKPGNTWVVFGVHFDANLPDAIEKETDAHLYSELK